MSAVVAGRTRIAEGREAEIFEWDSGRVLRLFRTQRSADVLDRETAAMRAVRDVVPLVPEVFDIVEVEGRPGIVMERIDGPDLITLLGSKPWQVYSAGTTLGKVHARINSIAAPRQLESLKDRLRRIAVRPGVPEAARGRLISLLEDLPDGDRLCHGDFHPGNMLMSPRGPVVIDWPNVTAGDPAADFARTELLLALGEPPPGTPSLVRYLQGVGRKVISLAYRRAYKAASAVDEALVERWRPARAADRLIAEHIDSEREKLVEILGQNGVLQPGDLPDKIAP
jgi:aminoglycoside phosphotransferase (APT) family kinase protein